MAKRKIQQAQLTAMISKFIRDVDAQWKFQRIPSHRNVFAELASALQPIGDTQEPERVFDGRLLSFEEFEQLTKEQLGI